MPNEFIIKINTDRSGNVVSLGDMPIEAADALKVFIESLAEFAKLHENTNDVRFGLKEGSVASVLTYPETGNRIGEDIQNILNRSSEENDQIRLFKAIQDKIKSNGLNYTVVHKYQNQERNVTHIFRERNFVLRRRPRAVWREKLEFIEGKLFNAGGKVNTNLHLERGEEVFKIDCDRDQAKKVNRFLYEDAFLAVYKRWKPNNEPKYWFVDSYSTRDSFEEYKVFYENIQANNSLTKYDVIHDKIVGIVRDENKSFGDLIKLMRLFNFEFSDRGIIRTILMALKPIRSQDTQLGEMYQQLTETLRKGSKNNIV